MGYHVPFAHRNAKPGSQPPVYIGFDSPHYANQRHHHQLHPARYSAPYRPFNWSGFFGLMFSLLSPFTLFLIAPIALIFSLHGMRRAPRGMAFFGTLFSLGGTAILATFFFAIFMSHHEEATAHRRAYQARVLQKQRAETSATLDAASSQLREFKSDNQGSLPNGVEGNVITINFSDAWGKELRYEAGKEQAVVRSAGPDGSFETGDDMLTTVAGVPRTSLVSIPAAEELAEQ